MKRIIISATSDLVTDQRVHKIAMSCVNAGHEVLVVGREKKDSFALGESSYKIKRFRLWFEKGPLFYASYNVCLFFYLLFRKADIYIANDLDTLAANYLASKIKGVSLLFDNHEYFTGVPELIERPFVRKFWKAIEKFIFPKLKYVYTVNESLKNIFEKEYKVPVSVVRNIPLQSLAENTPIETKGIPEGKKIIIYQGAVNKDRGIEEAILAMQYLDDVILLIIGDGDIMSEVKQLSSSKKLDDRVIFTGKIPFRNLSDYTRKADLGLCIEKATNINYTYALPNKLFDYIRCGVPVLASHLVEVEHIINKYQIGDFIQNHEPMHIAAQIRKCLDDEMTRISWKINLATASNELCWENEEKVFLELLGKAL